MNVPRSSVVVSVASPRGVGIADTFAPTMAARENPVVVPRTVARGAGTVSAAMADEDDENGEGDSKSRDGA